MFSLEKLELRVNEISNIESETFSKMKKLKYLDLSFNFLESLHEKVFQNLVKLEYISLGNNLLKSIDLKVFEGLFFIDELILSSNRIKFINIEKLNELQIREVNLDKNPVHKRLAFVNGTFSLKLLNGELKNTMPAIKPSWILFIFVLNMNLFL